MLVAPIVEKHTLKHLLMSSDIGFILALRLPSDTMLYLKQITNNNLLYSTWNSAQCYMAARMGEEFGRK